MISLNTHNTTIPDISAERSNKIIKDLLLKRAELWFIDIDKNIDIQAIQEYVESIWSDFESVVVLWVWGSALGTKALLEWFYGKYYNESQNKHGKNIYVLDNIDTSSITDLQAFIDISRTLFICISKSAGTIETLCEYIYFKEKCKAQNPLWQKQFCFIIGEKCSIKQKLEAEFQTFYIPENIGGRFSVFTPVWMLPLAFSGMDIDLFLQGISEIKNSMLSPNLDKNIALTLAHTSYKYYREWKNICVFFPYSSRFFQIGEWYKQLMWESIWKNGEGITLTSSLWVTDQHSQLQLYQDGPNDKLFLFLDVWESGQDIQIHKSIAWLSFEKLLGIEKYSTITSLKNSHCPVVNLSLWSLDEKHLGQLLYIFMFHIAYLWELFEINAFDQPGVEKGKIITRQKLKEDFWDIDIFKTAFYE